MKFVYNNVELETITKGYWPNGVTLICSDNGETWKIHKDVVLLRFCNILGAVQGSRADLLDGGITGMWKFWAILPK